MEQAKQGGNETAPEMAGYYRGAGCFSLKAAELNELLDIISHKDSEGIHAYLAKIRQKIK